MFLKFILIFPTIIFWVITITRNKLYDWGILKSYKSEIQTLCIGNVRVGGTGKSPFVEYLIRYFTQNGYKTGTLSRGYGRKTKGFLKAENGHSSEDLGDESYQYFKKFKNQISVFVGENRVKAVEKIKKTNLGIELLLLDDAFQHRAIESDFSIILSEYHRIFYEDYIIPLGRLRESRKGISRSDIIIITKCPENIEHVDMERIKNKCLNYSSRKLPVFFTTIKYSKPVPLFDKSETEIQKPIVLLSGIDNPIPFIHYCKRQFVVVDEITYPDHHNFNDQDILLMLSKMETVGSSILLTTEKDASRLESFKIKFNNTKIFYLPIEVQFISNESEFLSLLQKKFNVS